MLLLLTSNIFHTFSSVSIVDFEQISISREFSHLAFHHTSIGFRVVYSLSFKLMIQIRYEVGTCVSDAPKQAMTIGDIINLVSWL